MSRSGTRTASSTWSTPPRRPSAAEEEEVLGGESEDKVVTVVTSPAPPCVGQCVGPLAVASRGRCPAHLEARFNLDLKLLGGPCSEVPPNDKSDF